MIRMHQGPVDHTNQAKTPGPQVARERHSSGMEDLLNPAEALLAGLVDEVVE